ncbi:Lsr2 family protein [Streptomyces sp. NPDC088252]|uniref:histone-like nucleoid-structuring protein Lsr2 n=1 Tax=Streptomyces sp. NPDC088252 TaxID=3365845 RepID=UPI0038141614
MAQRVHITYTDDLTGTEGDNVATHTFALDGTTYEIDLGDGSHDQLLKALAPFMKAGRRIKRSRTGAASAPARSKDSVEIRKWAKDNGHEVSDRGRVPALVREAFAAAQNS